MKNCIISVLIFFYLKFTVFYEGLILIILRKRRDWNQSNYWLYASTTLLDCLEVYR